MRWRTDDPGDREDHPAGLGGRAPGHRAVTRARTGVARRSHATVPQMRGGRRVLVSGMGSELGSLVATLLEKAPWTGEITGLDIDPPRRRLRSATFHRVEPRDRRKMVRIVRDFDPHVVVHAAVWEPNARAHPGDAADWTHSAAIGVLGAAAECPSLEHLVVRSGIS